MTAEVIAGDCRTVLAGVEAESIDACVTDPPYELGFMGKSWDRSGVSVDPATWAAVLRVMKPGGYLLAFGGTRTMHRIACAIEDAGFEVRDSLVWLYGSGFPKNARAALKPAHEPILLARKPMIGTLAQNEAKHGTGALAIDACRVGSDVVGWGGYGRGATDAGTWNTDTSGLRAGDARPVAGRWPANVLLDEGAAAMLDAQSGERPVSGAARKGRASAAGRTTARSTSVGGGMIGNGRLHNDTGGASRFFYVAKPSPREKAAGLDGRNPHPTVKPIALMRWLVRLVTPAGGVVLDPFAGSGTTGCAARLEGLRFVGIEADPVFADLARRRVAHWEAEA